MNVETRRFIWGIITTLLAVHGILMTIGKYDSMWHMCWQDDLWHLFYLGLMCRGLNMVEESIKK